MSNLRNAVWLTEKLGLSSVQRAYDLARQKIVPSVHVGRLVKFDPVKIDEFIQTGGKTVADGDCHHASVEDAPSEG